MKLKPKLDLSITTAVVLGWIESVKTREQLELTREAIEKFITDRFKNDPDLKDAQLKLDLAIDEKSQTIPLSK